MILATKTKLAIDTALEVDGGAKFRSLLREAINACGDAFDPEEQTFRSHLGCSLLGKQCARELWYSFRWASKKEVSGRIQRLFNRGHMEEGRFVALLRMINCLVLPHDETGKQYRVSGHLGHVGGSLDGVVRDLPDLAPGTWALQEFKTHSDKSFKKVAAEGVRAAKPEHYVQQQLYMHHYNLKFALYGSVNKNDDDLHLEIVANDEITALQFLDRGAGIVDSPEPPPKISSSPGWFACKFCDAYAICHQDKSMLVNCRTCRAALPIADGAWVCRARQQKLSKELQLVGCDVHDPIK